MIADQFDAFFFDLDGVVYLADEALPDAVESIGTLADKGKELRFLTNDPRPTRESIVTNLHRIGIEAEIEQIVTSGWATAKYLSQQHVSPVAIVGSDGLESEIKDQGIEVTNDSPEAVVVGAYEHASYADIRRATRQIDRGAALIGTNPDGSFPSPDGPAPGAGSIVRAVETAANEKATVVGKPEPLMFEMARSGLSRTAQIAVVGDNPSTDILGAHRAGLTGILVATDEPTRASHRDLEYPDQTIATLADLFSVHTERWDAVSYDWPNEVRPGVGAVVLDDEDRVLLVKRSDKETWALPTGNIEKCESVTEAIVREVQEETGLDVTVERLTGIYSNPAQQIFTYPSGESIQYLTCCFACSVDGGSVRADHEETVAVEFCDIHQLPRTMLEMQREWISHAIRNRDSPAVQ